jgi:hypothetical protein
VGEGRCVALVDEHKDMRQSLASSRAFGLNGGEDSGGILDAANDGSTGCDGPATNSDQASNRTGNAKRIHDDGDESPTKIEVPLNPELEKHGAFSTGWGRLSVLRLVGAAWGRPAPPPPPRRDKY